MTSSSPARRLVPLEGVAALGLAALGLAILALSRQVPPPRAVEPAPASTTMASSIATPAPATTGPAPAATAPAPAASAPPELAAPGSASSRPGARPGSVHFEPPHGKSGSTSAVAPKPVTTARGPVVQALAETDLMARLRVVDLLLNDGQFPLAEEVTLALLDHPLADTDEEPQRIAVLSRMGFVPHSVPVDRRLTAALGKDRPRAERLTAVDALARGQGLHPLYKSSLEPVAASDADAEVQRRARTALGQ